MLTLLALIGSQDAFAGNSVPYMWGVGPQVSTVVYPTRFPGGFPKDIPDEWNFDASRGDIEFALRGAFYLNTESRLAGRIGLGGGPGWFTRWADVGLDRMLTSNSGFHTLVGANLGLGRDRFTDSGGRELEVSNAVIRAQFGGIYRNKTQAYELGVFMAYHVPFEHLYDPGGLDEQTLKGSGSRYGMIGVEASVFFGDFTPPKSKKKKNKSSKTKG